MHRTDKEITDRETMESILREATVIRIGMSDPEGPYVVPMNFVFSGGCIYLHSARHGRKVDILRRDPRVCFETDIDSGTIPGDTVCRWGFRYRSVIGFGRAVFLENPEEKREALNSIVQKYSGISSGEYTGEKLQGVAVIRIDIDRMTGKQDV